MTSKSTAPNFARGGFHALLSGREGRKTINHPQVGHLHFERLTFQVFDTPDLKVSVYTALDEADTPRKMQQLLDLWYQQVGQGHPVVDAYSRIPSQPSPH